MKEPVGSAMRWNPVEWARRTAERIKRGAAGARAVYKAGVLMADAIEAQINRPQLTMHEPPDLGPDLVAAARPSCTLAELVRRVYCSPAGQWYRVNCTADDAIEAILAALDRELSEHTIIKTGDAYEARTP